jgi:hypothetical protein
LRRTSSCFKRDGLISSWHDQQISAGTEWAGQIEDQLSSAHVILLLVSADFLASDYCYDVEMRRAMERHDAGEARVIPVILRPVDNWQQAPFGKLHALPHDGKPIILWQPLDLAFVDVAAGIRAAIAELGRTRPRRPVSDNRSRMLLRVRRTWVEGVLDDSLHGAALQALGLLERPEAVPDEWNLVVQELEQVAHAAVGFTAFSATTQTDSRRRVVAVDRVAVPVFLLRQTGTAPRRPRRPAVSTGFDV